VSIRFAQRWAVIGAGTVPRPQGAGRTCAPKGWESPRPSRSSGRPPKDGRCQEPGFGVAWGVRWPAAGMLSPDPMAANGASCATRRGAGVVVRTAGSVSYGFRRHARVCQGCGAPLRKPRAARRREPRCAWRRPLSGRPRPWSAAADDHAEREEQSGRHEAAVARRRRRRSPPLGTGPSAVRLRGRGVVYRDVTGRVSAGRPVRRQRRASRRPLSLAGGV
jgi:hypothetical protein